MTPLRLFCPLRLLFIGPLLLTACAVEDSHIAHEAETRLIGMAEVDLEACLGVPDQHSTFGTTEILTYYATSTSSDSWSIPLIGGFAFNNGAYCHATFQLKDGRVTQILYSGEKNATFAPDAYCAPIMRTCVAHLRQEAAAAAPARLMPGSAAPASVAPATTVSPPPATPSAAQPAAEAPPQSVGKSPASP